MIFHFTMFLGLMIAWPVFALPSDGQKKAFKLHCVDSGILRTLVLGAAKACPKEIKNLKPGDKSTLPISCLLSNRKQKVVTTLCREAALSLWREIPTYFRPDVEGLE